MRSPAGSHTETARAPGSPAVEQPALKIAGVGKTFGSTVALRDVDLTVARGEFVTLLGPSGSGKTTLLRIIVGFEKPTSGRLLLRGQDISGMSPAERDVGMVFQQYALFPHMTVEGNIGYGLKVRGWDRAARRRRVSEMLDLVRLPALESRYPRQLSGGQQQRVALARALAYDPEVILMDEPLGALDRTLRIEMEEEIRRIHRDFGATIVYVTHDQQEALALSDRIAIMRESRLISVGTPEELYYRPANSFVASFFANANLLPVERHELRDDGTALVQYQGGQINCPAANASGGDMVLAVRRRSLRSEAVNGSLRLAGAVTETLLFGDDRQVTFDVQGVSVVALLDARTSDQVEVGDQVEFFVPAEEAILVPRR